MMFPVVVRSRAGWVLLGLLLLVWSVLFRPVNLGGPAGYVLVGGSSMEPTLSADTLVLTIAEARYELGDVIAFRVSHGLADDTPLVIHRIAGGNADEGFVTQGDNMPLPDPWRVQPGDILGKQVAAVPNMAPALAFARSPIVLASLAAGIATYIVLGWSGSSLAQTRPKVERERAKEAVAALR